MIKFFLITLPLLLLSSCAPKPKASDFSDDYVLIEFAAKLEEDYQKLYPEPLDNREKLPTE